MLFRSIAGAGSGIHIEQELHTLPGSLNHSAFERAWSTIVARHAVLRTAFVRRETERTAAGRVQRGAGADRAAGLAGTVCW